MNQNQKKLQLNRALSIALSLLVVVAITVTVIAVVASRRSKPDKNGDETSASSSTSQSTPSTSDSKPVVNNPDTDSPVVAEKVTFIAPVTVGNIIKECSAEIPVFSSTMEDYRVHLGIDIAADVGSPVYAAADGTIETVDFDPMMGQTIVITHADGYKTVYQNLQTAVPSGIEVGTKVAAGDEIGTIGDTALIEISEEPHLHFEIYKDELCEDPLSHFTVIPIDAATDYED